MQNNGTKNCEKCSKEFLITAQEQKFYEKKSLPIPQLCPKCRRDRRRGLRNIPKLFKRTCDKCKTALLSTYPTDSPYQVYCEKCYFETLGDSKV